jgi:hypothetical protein
MAEHDDDRTTSMGLFNTAEAYRLSAIALDQAPQVLRTGHAAKPVQFLYSHASFTSRRCYALRIASS